MSDLIECDENQVEEQAQRPPLCLRNYFDEHDGRLAQMPVKKPPGTCRARVIERRGNVIVLEFADAPKAPAPKPRRRAGFGRWCRSGWDVAMVLLFLGTAVACLAALLR